MTELNPCRFCNEIFLEINPGNRVVQCVWFYVICPTCLARGPLAPTEAEAIGLWNDGVSEEGSDES